MRGPFLSHFRHCFFVCSHDDDGDGGLWNKPYGPCCIDRQVRRVYGKLSSVRRSMALLFGGSFHAPSPTALCHPSSLFVGAWGEIVAGVEDNWNGVRCLVRVKKHDSWCLRSAASRADRRSLAGRLDELEPLAGWGGHTVGVFQP